MFLIPFEHPKEQKIPKTPYLVGKWLILYEGVWVSQKKSLHGSHSAITMIPRILLLFFFFFTTLKYSDTQIPYYKTKEHFVFFARHPTNTQSPSFFLKE